MSEEKKCCCPVCNQGFMPDEGCTPEEHLAKGIIKLCREMQEFPHKPELACPRCGHSRMEPTLTKNAMSRHAEVYICCECGRDEALRASADNVMPITAWQAVNEILKCLPGFKCPEYTPEKGKAYPLCDNPECEQSGTCNISAHMEDDGGYSKYDK